ncbi:hypothetical protein E2C01_017480 [Portunus trituberculatus]|uniref:Uncharacterized protein n=1 Tax=Portunus trituberculatus TaxID=210409 RepID=A0A5B7DSL2_PORTR|nr:hypothetical protein [Portunus trituberculatus]
MATFLRLYVVGFDPTLTTSSTTPPPPYYTITKNAVQGKTHLDTVKDDSIHLFRDRHSAQQTTLDGNFPCTYHTNSVPGILPRRAAYTPPPLLCSWPPVPKVFWKVETEVSQGHGFEAARFLLHI